MKQTPKAAEREADSMKEDPEKLESVSARAEKKADEYKGRIKSGFSDIRLLVRMVKAYAKGDYRQVPWSTVSKFVGGLIYFVWAIDLIPDFIAGIGFLDDLTVIAWIIRSAKKDIDAFEIWEESKKPVEKSKSS